MEKMIIKNKTVITTTRYVELNGFEYTIDHLKRVRFVSYVGSKELTREARRAINEKTIAHIRANVDDILVCMDHYLDESATSTTIHNQAEATSTMVA